jgi:hypothetical protein
MYALRSFEAPYGVVPSVFVSVPSIVGVTRPLIGSKSWLIYGSGATCDDKNRLLLTSSLLGSRSS